MVNVPTRSKLELRCNVAAVGRPPHYSGKSKSAALCREAAALIFLDNEFSRAYNRPKNHFTLVNEKVPILRC